MIFEKTIAEDLPELMNFCASQNKEAQKFVNITNKNKCILRYIV